VLCYMPCVEGLQHLLTACDSETAINSLGLDLNYRKSVCMRISPCYSAPWVSMKTPNSIAS